MKGFIEVSAMEFGSMSSTNPEVSIAIRTITKFEAINKRIRSQIMLGEQGRKTNDSSYQITEVAGGTVLYLDNNSCMYATETYQEVKTKMEEALVYG